MDSSIINDLVCPQTGEALKLEDGELFTSSTSYPIFNDIPWLFKNPEFSFLEWGTKITAFVAAEKRFLVFLQLLLKSEDNKLSITRIKKLYEAKQKNLAVFEQHLSIFAGHEQITLTPSHQQIQSYYQLIFRDWCWETEENNQYIDFIKENAPKECKKILVLGAGAAGLSYKIAKHFNNSQVISTDHNPFLFFMAADIFKGKETTLTDYSFYPKSLATTTHHWNIKNTPLKQKNHHFILGGFPHLPFKEESFDLIIAPWFFDILDDDYQASIQTALKYLSKDGNLISIGPANVHKKDISKQLCSDEQVQLYKNLFNKIETTQKTTHYLNNPIDSQSRMEEVLYICGNKKNKSQVAKQSATSSKVVFTNDLQQYKLINDSFHRVLKYVTDDIELSELSKKVQEEFGFEKEQAEFYTETIMKKIKMDM